MTSNRRRHRQHGNPFNVRGELEQPDWRSIFGRTAPFALEVGFGGGRFPLELARAHPEWDVVGIEIREHFVEDLLAAAREEGLPNVHALVANANVHTEQLLPDASTVFVSVNFPDPWFKKRHHKRRVVRTEWLERLRPKLQTNAEIHVMTDYEPIAIEIQEIFAACPDFVNLAGEGRFAAQSTTGLTSEREQTHLRRGEPVWRLQLRYTPA